jgi:hypothetical protein
VLTESVDVWILTVLCIAARLSKMSLFGSAEVSTLAQLV